MFSVLYIYSDLCAYRDSRPVFTKQIHGGWACRSFVLSNVCSCKVVSHSTARLVITTFVFCPFWKCCLLRQPIKYSRDNQYCPTCVSDLFRNAECETFFIVLPSWCVSIPAKLSISKLTARMDSEGWEYVSDNWIKEIPTSNQDFMLETVLMHFWDVAQRLVYYMFLQWHFTTAFFPPAAVQQTRLGISPNWNAGFCPHSFETSPPPHTDQFPDWCVCSCISIHLLQVYWLL